MIRQYILKDNEPHKITGKDYGINITKRENEVLRYMASGYTSTEIAKDLFISEHTVISHRKNLMIKLDARNSAHLVLRSIRFGLLE